MTFSNQLNRPSQIVQCIYTIKYCVLTVITKSQSNDFIVSSLKCFYVEILSRLISKVWYHLIFLESQEKFLNLKGVVNPFFVSFLSVNSAIFTLKNGGLNQL